MGTSTSRSERRAAEVRRDNPYVGARAFESGESLYGRDGEREELIELLIADRIVLCHSPSGVGKTSLVQAVVLPALKRRAGFTVLPTMRVGARPSDPELAVENPFLAGALLGLHSTARGEPLPSGADLPESELVRLRFEDYLGVREPGDQRPVILVFDQFEEIFTLHRTQRASREEFFCQVGAALQERHRWALFLMRDEFVATLQPYLHYIPTGLATRFRLDLLDADAAEQAIRKPAWRQPFGVHIARPAARFITDALSTVNTPEGMVQLDGAAIEPVQLQIVCTYLWDKLQPEPGSRVTVDQVRAYCDVDAALAGYYASAVARAASVSGVREEHVRRWIGEALIDRQGRRLQVANRSESDFKLNERTVASLVGDYVIREDERRGVWYELAHDRLVAPILADNEEWAERNMSELERLAAAWHLAGESAALLLRSEAILKQVAWLERERPELSPRAQNYLDQSTRHEEAAQLRRREVAEVARLRRRARRWKWAVVSSVPLAFIGFGAVNLFQRHATEEVTQQRYSADTARTTILKARLDTLFKQWGNPELQSIAGADSAIRAQLAGSENHDDRSRVRVVYFVRPDSQRAMSALSRLGYRVAVQAPRGTFPTNTVAAGDSVPAADIKLVTLHLIRAGVAIRSVCSILNPVARGRHMTLEILGAPRAVGYPPISLAQIEAITGGRTEINCRR